MTTTTTTTTFINVTILVRLNKNQLLKKEMTYYKNFGEDNSSKEVAYDLRQGYAKLLMSSLDNIKKYREERDYKNWFEELDGLFIDISMKLHDEEKDGYNKMVKELNEHITENPNAYTNKQIEGSKIYISLKKINMWLLRKMEENDIFGSKFVEDDGL